MSGRDRSALAVLRRADLHRDVVRTQALKHQRRPLHAKVELHVNSLAFEPIVDLAHIARTFEHESTVFRSPVDRAVPRPTRSGLQADAGVLVLMAGALVITLAVNVPIDAEISGWTATTLPADWSNRRDHWERYHTIRTFVSIGALGCAIASALRWTAASDRRRLARDAR